MPEGLVQGFRSTYPHTCMDAKGANGAGSAAIVSEQKAISISVASDGGGDADFVLKFQGSIQETEPTWDSAQAVDNMWDYIEVVDLEDGAAIDGDTGITFSGDDYRQLEANTNGLKWINCIMSSRTAGEATVKMKSFRNE